MRHADRTRRTGGLDALRTGDFDCHHRSTDAGRRRARRAALGEEHQPDVDVVLTGHGDVKGRRGSDQDGAAGFPDQRRHSMARRKAALLNCEPCGNSAARIWQRSMAAIARSPGQRDQQRLADVGDPDCAGGPSASPGPHPGQNGSGKVVARLLHAQSPPGPKAVHCRQLRGGEPQVAGK